MTPKSNRPVDWEALVTDHEQSLYRAALAILAARHRRSPAMI